MFPVCLLLETLLLFCEVVFVAAITVLIEYEPCVAVIFVGVTLVVVF